MYRWLLGCWSMIMAECAHVMYADIELRSTSMMVVQVVLEEGKIGGE